MTPKFLYKVGFVWGLQRWWKGWHPTRARVYVVLYATFLLPAHLLSYLLLVEMQRVEQGAALDAWSGWYLLLPLFLCAPYGLTKLFLPKKPWPARASAFSTALGLVATAFLAHSDACQGVAQEGETLAWLVRALGITEAGAEEEVAEVGETLAWLVLFCRTQPPVWALVLAFTPHLAVMLWVGKAVSAAASVAATEVQDDEGVSGSRSVPTLRRKLARSVDWMRRTAQGGVSAATSGARETVSASVPAAATEAQDVLKEQSAHEALRERETAGEEASLDARPAPTLRRKLTRSADWTWRTAQGGMSAASSWARRAVSASAPAAATEAQDIPKEQSAHEVPCEPETGTTEAGSAAQPAPTLQRKLARSADWMWRTTQSGVSAASSGAREASVAVANQAPRAIRAGEKMWRRFTGTRERSVNPDQQEPRPQD